MLKKICGMYLFAVAVLVAVHTVVEPLYHASGPGQPYSPFWTIVNPLTALAIVLGAVFSYTRKRGAGGETVTREFLAANTRTAGNTATTSSFWTCWT